MESQNLDFRIYIEGEYQKRVAKNPSYSRRAFAKDLKITSPFLGRVLRGERKISLENAFDMIRILKWKGVKATVFLLLVRLDNAEDETQRQELIAEIKDAGNEVTFRELEGDLYSFFAKWYHGAIFELTKTADFRAEPKWIAKRLGLDAVSSELAIDRLFRLGFLKDDDGKAVASHPNITIKDLPSAALREFHREMLSRSMQMLDEEKLENRRVSGAMFAMDSRLLGVVDRKIEEFRQELIRFIEQKSKECDSVHHLCISFLKLDRK
jgi:uncharacterized protein (TIGR02147 family)